MKVALLSNYFNHHQKPLADELYRLLGDGGFYFITTTEVPEFRKKLGYEEISAPYILKYNSEDHEDASRVIMNFDVLVFGGNIDSFQLAKERIREGKLTFQMAERWLKRGFVNFFSPNLLKQTISYWSGKWWRKPIYRLCMSAYAPNDLYLMRQYRNKCFKWGYFTKVDGDFEVEAPELGASTSEITPIMWCARFLKLKHPELPVQLAARLKAKGYRFTIDMFGSGEELENTKTLITQLGVEDCVNLCGNRANDEILEEMRNHSIFLFTSDRHEGWGAVLNEAMSNGCVPIAAEAIGSVPFLVKDGVNGMIFKTNNILSLEGKVVELIENRSLIENMSINARETMKLWSPKVAAHRLLELIEAKREGRDTPFENGPCSKALPI